MNKNKIYPIYFVFPILIIYTTGFILPMLTGVGLSFTNWSLVNTQIRFVGLDNYKEIFLYDSSMIRVITNTLKFAVVTTFFANVIGLLLALLFDQGLRTKNVLRSIFYFPSTLSILVIGLVFSSILHPTSGFLNQFLEKIGLGILANSWLVNPILAMPSVMSVEVWRMTGFCMVIYLAGLQMVPQAYLDAAKVDGAGGVNKLFRIIIPLIMPSITINVVLNLVAELKVFDIIFVLTGGGPGRLTHVINTVIFDEFGSGRYGIANALETIMLIMTSIFAFFLLRYFARKEVDA